MDNSESKNENLDEQLNQAAGQRIAGDSDDSPLSEETIAKMLRWLGAIGCVG